MHDFKMIKIKLQKNRLKIGLLYDVSLLSIYPNDSKSAYYKDTCTPMFITTLCTVASKQSQPSTNDEIMKM